MKYFKVLMGVALVLLASLVVQATGNVLLGVATIPAVTYLVQVTAGFSLFSADKLVLGSLISIKRPGQGQPNPGGGRRLFLVPINELTAEWPKRADIIAGELTVAPPLQVAAAGPPAITAGAFVEVDVSDASLKIDQALKGASGYQSWEQSVEVKIAGFNAAQCAGIDKLLNQEVVAVVLSNDGTRIVVGSSFNGLQFEITNTSGAKGSDRREWSLKAKQDGYMFGYQPIATSVVIPGIV
ncbi:hypothetical protein [uncultured Fibrella sp.]|uniref:hypothetical protein n=1 Tax=uncultured Fibrella sp. TaxID=1284596 RepID=UPI0035CA2E72